MVTYLSIRGIDINRNVTWLLSFPNTVLNVILIIANTIPHIVSFHLQKNFMKKLLLLTSMLQTRKLRLKEAGNLLKDTQVVSGRAGIRTQVAGFQSMGS